MLVPYHCEVEVLFRRKFFYCLLAGSALLSPLKIFSQSTFLPLNSDSYQFLSRFEILSGTVSDELHFSATPLLRSKAADFLDSMKLHFASLNEAEKKEVDYLLIDNDEWTEDSLAKSKKPFLKYFYRDKASLYQFRNNDFMVKINPVFDFEIGAESASGETLFTNTRGVEVRGWIAKRVGYLFYLTENQARYPEYVRERTDSFGVVPYQGYFKDFKTSGVDFFEAKGYFDFTAAKFITIQFGHDKNFLGDGIRSLALSDYSENYLFLKLNTQVWKINYQNLFMDLTADFLRGGDTLLPKKYAAVHHISINAAKWLNVGAFETVVFHRNDGYELQYLNPIIFYRSIEQGLGSPDNTTIGIDYRVNFLHRFSWYGQVMVDDYNIQASKGKHGYWGNKTGIQQGIKYINAFDLKNLDLQFEWNAVRPYTYTHNDSIANYSHYNQPLAHPLGANFNELIGLIHYRPIFPLSLSAEVLYSSQGRDTSYSNWGSNIFIPTTESNIETVYDNKIAQGVKSHLFYFTLNASYMIRHNLFIDGEYIFRKTSSDEPAFASHTNVFQIGIRMNMWKNDFDF